MTEPIALEFLPDSDTEIKQLFVLLHGVGATPHHLAALIQAVRSAFPAAAILVPAGFEPFDGAEYGRQWFSVRDIDDGKRAERVAQALPALIEYVQAAQARFNLFPPDTALVGFSQGAIMALEMVQVNHSLAGRVLAFAGRYATLPKVPPEFTTIHFLHGSDDAVIDVVLAQQAQLCLEALKGDSTLDVIPQVGHELHPALIKKAIDRLQTCIPLRSWEAALGLTEAPSKDKTVH
jgi:phospholipase/carboxylesterase